MNAIVRLILRGVASGDVTLTPRVLGTLKTLNQVQPDTTHPISADEPSPCFKAKISKQRQSPTRRITKL